VTARASSLAKDSVAKVSRIVAPDKRQPTERVGKIARRHFDLVLAGVDVVLDR
jgi:mRNA-degrading endonuclease toxin of MazEF toxin-antitoxin module